MKAPSFKLPDQAGIIHDLSEVRGSWALVYFYPKDNTTGCTIEACAIRDSYPQFKKLGITVFGISVDPVSSHKKFSEKYQLPFTLLADEDKKTVRMYGVWAKKKFMGRGYMGTLRTSFLIDPKGRIAKIYQSVKPPTHADEILKDLKSLIG